jgi:hypothetical protein
MDTAGATVPAGVDWLMDAAVAAVAAAQPAADRAALEVDI